MSEAKDLIVVREPPVEEPPPPPSRPAPRPPEPDLAERITLFVELRPWTTAAIIFASLTLLHIVFLNLAGSANGFFVGDKSLFASGSTLIEIALLALIAYNVILPTLIAHACIRAYHDLRPSLMLDDRSYGERRAGIVDSFFLWRFWIGVLWAALPTPVFGAILSGRIQADGAAYALLAIWMYVRIALIFGLLGANVAYFICLHHRYRIITGEHLRVDLFDIAALSPIPRYAKQVAFYLLVLLALVGPAVAQPDAPAQSAALFGLGFVLAAIAVLGAMSGARKSVRAAKKAAIAELSAYARELWRRAYAGQRIVEAVAVPALGAMIIVRNDIRRIGGWVGGFGVVRRVVALAFIPLLAWFGGQIATHLLDVVSR